MIQSKDLLLRRVKETSGILDQLIGSFPDNKLGLTQADVEQQIYTATGFQGEHFLQLTDEALETVISQKGKENQSVFLDFLGNLFYYEYQQTGSGKALLQAQKIYQRLQKESGVFSMVYFQRMQQQS